MRYLLFLCVLAGYLVGAPAVGQDSGKNAVTIPVEAVIRTFGSAGKTRWLTYGFMPSTIEVTEGQTVTLELTSKDGTHSLAIPKLGVRSDQVHRGQTTRVTFVASKAGTYAIECHADCESDNKKMPGQLIVLPAPAP